MLLWIAGSSAQWRLLPIGYGEIEFFFNKLKQFRWVFSRFASTMSWLR